MLDNLLDKQVTVLLSSVPPMYFNGTLQWDSLNKAYYLETNSGNVCCFYPYNVKNVRENLVELKVIIGV